MLSKIEVSTVTMQIEQSDSLMQVTVQEDMTIYTAASLKEQFLNLFNKGTAEIELDLSNVGEIDSAGLQILLQLKAESEKRAFTLRLLRHSPAVIDVIGLLKLGMYFGDPIVIPADWNKS
jgi:anti-sigma B factor antagonist